MLIENFLKVKVMNIELGKQISSVCVDSGKCLYYYYTVGN